MSIRLAQLIGNRVPLDDLFYISRIHKLFIQIKCQNLPRSNEPDNKDSNKIQTRFNKIQTRSQTNIQTNMQKARKEVYFREVLYFDEVL
jgi:hypothetical protein